MLYSPSHYQQSEKRNNRVKQNIGFILSHFKEPIFPRVISSRSIICEGTEFQVVYNEEDMFEAYEQSKFIDCRVSVCRSSNLEYNSHEENQNTQLAEMITISLYKPIFMRESAQIKALYAILQAIKRILTGKPTILWSMATFHIYQPIVSQPLELIKELNHIIKQFPQLQLAFGLSTPKFSISIFDYSHQQEWLQNHTTLLIPGTFNSINIGIGREEYEEITLIQKWDGYRPQFDSTRFDHVASRPYIGYDDSKEFLFCKWCFWCASNLNTKNLIAKCPICGNSDTLTSLPISNKVDEIDRSQKIRIKRNSDKDNYSYNDAQMREL
jgi:hypothetical protein